MITIPGAVEVSITEDGVYDSLEVGLEVVNLFEGSGDFAINHDGRLVTNLNGVVDIKEPMSFGHTVVDKDDSGHVYNVFPVGLGESILGLTATGGSLESNSSFESELPGGPRKGCCVKVALDGV
jgi:hypothetical protein